MAKGETVRRDAVVDLLGTHARPMHAGEIASRLGVPARYRLELNQVLDELAFDGVLKRLGGQRYRLAARAAQARSEAFEGVVHVNARGFGFVTGTELEADVFVPQAALAGAMHGDQVRARVVSRSRRGLEGEVLEVLGRARRRVTGILRRAGKSQWLEPDDERIRGPIVLRGAARRPRPDDPPPRNGLAAVAEIITYPELADENPEAELVAVLGKPGEPAVEVAKILLEHEIDDEHPPEALAEAAALPAEIDAAELGRREDLSHLPFVTIDPADARDHDDAVWVERRPGGGHTVWVAVADVSHYVRPGTALDQSSLGRGCSVYLPDRAVPMLPSTLSAGLCSLGPGVRRLCLCVEVTLDPTGAVERSRISEGWMRSSARLSYRSAARALGFTTAFERDPQAEALREELGVMWEVASVLRRRRMRRGALDLDLPEARIELDPDTGLPVRIEQRSHDPGVRKAYRLIEELMLLANETCARFVIEHDLGAIFRIHAPPDPEKLERFASQAAELDLAIDPDELEAVSLSPRSLTKLLRRIDKHPKRAILHGLLLRAMQQARYEPQNVGHYGLASEAYLHFSSPIRRYPDLVVHRVLRAALRGEQPRGSDGQADAQQPHAWLRQAANTASERERNAMETERQIADLYRAIYMRDRIGEVLEGVVTAITHSGVFVQIADPFVDVLVGMDVLGRESYEMDENGLRAVGLRSGDAVGLGDALRIEIEDVSLGRRAVYGRRVLGKAEGGGADRKRLRKRRTGEERGKGRGDNREKGGRRAAYRRGGGQR